MTQQEELKILAKRHRWAFKELVYDAKMIEANRLYGNSGMPAYRHLRTKYSGVVILQKSIKELEAFQQTIPDCSSKKALMQTILDTSPWILGELVVTEKENEAKELFVSATAMYQYLKEVWSSRGDILEMLRWLIRIQKEPRKTLCL